MGTRRPARLYQKNSGVFFIRILLATSKLARSEKRQNKQELRRSLGTKSVTVARSISTYMNALLERVSIDERTAVVNQYLPHAINTWTLPGGVQASGEDDQRRLSAFLKAHPLIEQALAQRIANAPWTLPSPAPQTHSTLPAISMHESSISVEPQPQAQASASQPPAPPQREQEAHSKTIDSAGIIMIRSIGLSSQHRPAQPEPSTWLATRS